MHDSCAVNLASVSDEKAGRTDNLNHQFLRSTMISQNRL